jgi:putative PIN family toxin of toxin-antitoxin system
MIVVLDTNVIVSGLLSSSGPLAEIINLWKAERFEVVTSPLLLSELEHALLRQPQRTAQAGVEENQGQV